MNESTAVERDGYTWTTAIRDLALSTHLTLQEAGELVSSLRECNVEDVDPYDAAGPLIRLANAWGTNWGMVGVALRGLVDIGWYNGDKNWLDNTHQPVPKFIDHDFGAPPPPPIMPLRCGTCGAHATAYIREAGTIIAQPCGHPFDE